MAFFTRYHANIPMLPVDDDTLLEHSTDPLRQSEQIDRLSQILKIEELYLETPDSVEYINNLKKFEEILESGDEQEVNDRYLTDIWDESSDIQVGYQVRRSGRFKNVVEKSQMLENSIVFDKEASLELSENSNVPTENSTCLRPPLGNDNDALSTVSLTDENLDSVNEHGVVKCDSGDTNVSENSDDAATTRYKYVVDRVLGVQV